MSCLSAGGPRKDLQPAAWKLAWEDSGGAKRRSTFPRSTHTEIHLGWEMSVPQEGPWGKTTNGQARWLASKSTPSPQNLRLARTQSSLPLPIYLCLPPTKQGTVWSAFLISPRLFLFLTLASSTSSWGEMGEGSCKVMPQKCRKCLNLLLPKSQFFSLLIHWFNPLLIKSNYRRKHTGI